MDKYNILLQILPLIFDNLDNPRELLLTCKTISATKYRLTLYSEHYLNINKQIFKKYRWKKITSYQDRTLDDNDLQYLQGIHTLQFFRRSNVTDIGIGYLSGIHTLYLSTDNIITNIKCLAGVKDLKLTLTTVTDDDLQYLQGIQSLNLDGSKITDDGLKYLTGIHTLSLYLNTKITDCGLKYLSGITNLDLYLNKNITDDGLKYLQGIRYLSLWSNKNITDNSMRYLESVESLYIFSEKITNDGIKHLTNLKQLMAHPSSPITIFPWFTGYKAHYGKKLIYF